MSAVTMFGANVSLTFCFFFIVLSANIKIPFTLDINTLAQLPFVSDCVLGVFRSTFVVLSCVSWALIQCLPKFI